ncbi:MAG TPA: SCO1664 family protein [Cryptosporangiaceae bacterium]|nr:SCO1664 family protein [Cryptosporangiaceae bacterium]
MPEPPGPREELDPGFDIAETLTLLSTGTIEVEGRLVDASNATLLGRITLDGVTVDCVYKPVRGERPLWDFPDGTLAGREVATYLLDQATGWCQVPPTVLRDGPFGVGMCQLWIHTEDISELVDLIPRNAVPAGWRAIVGGTDPTGREVVLAHADDVRLRRLALLDVVANNADRKGGHLLLTGHGALYGVDHGLSFHTEDKLRTLLWGWAGEPLAEDEREVLRRVRAELDAELGEALAEHVRPREVKAARLRLDRLLREDVFPQPGGRWPAVPWPAF